MRGRHAKTVWSRHKTKRATNYKCNCEKRNQNISTHPIHAKRPPI
jgi:hypothetical protein